MCPIFGVPANERDDGLVGTCVTDTEGKCTVGEKETGDYLVLAKYTDRAGRGFKTIYTGTPKGANDFKGDPPTAEKHLQIIKVVDDFGVYYRSAKRTWVKGSFLEIVSPDYVMWENGVEVYPFIFTSDSTWEIDVCLEVPDGYVLHEGDCQQMIIANESNVIMFTAEDIASPEPDFTVIIKVKDPKGKETKIKEQIRGLRSAEMIAEHVPQEVQRRGIFCRVFGIFCKNQDEKDVNQKGPLDKKK